MTGASEKAQQAAIVELLRTVGGEVWVLGTRRGRGDYQGTRQTPGLPDILAFMPVGDETVRLYRFLAVEVKVKGGRLRPEQQTFRELCRWAGLWHLTGDLDTVVAWLIEQDLLEQKGATLYATRHRTRRQTERTAGDSGSRSTVQRHGRDRGDRAPGTRRQRC